MENMKILLIGNTGQLGWELQRSLMPFGEVVGIDFPEINLTDNSTISHWIQKEKPDVIFNAAAYTAMDLAENEKDLAYQINASGPGFLAEEAASSGAILVHYSTNYVFDGSKESPYLETDAPNPINVYGESKLAGEQNIDQVGGIYFVFRTSWLYSTRKDSFVKKVLEWSRNREELKIVIDQISSPTWSRTLADMTAQWLDRIKTEDLTWRKKRSGIYHLAGDGAVSRYDWAVQILKLDPKRNEQIITSLKPASSDEFPTPAKRPEYSALNTSLFQEVFNLTIPPWLTSLELALSSSNE